MENTSLSHGLASLEKVADHVFPRQSPKRSPSSTRSRRYRTHWSDPPVLAHAETPFYHASRPHRAFDRPIPRLELARVVGERGVP